MNKCVNKSYLKEVNAKRALHGAADLSTDSGAAAEIQKQMADPAYTSPEDLECEGSYEDCNQLVYKYELRSTQAEMNLMIKPDTAVGSWYKGQQYYDFQKGTVVDLGEDATAAKKDKAKKAQEAFTQLVWLSSEKVGFGIKDEYVVAWFCPAGNEGSAHDYVENVNPVCIVDGYNRCYNNMALKYHNQMRALREDTDALRLDPEIAAKI